MSRTFREPAATPARRASDRLRLPGVLQHEAIDILHLIEKHRRLFCAVTLTVIAAALAAAVLLPSVYSTSSTVMLEPRKNNVTEQSSVLSETPTDPASIQNQIQLLTSRDLAARVVEKLGLDRDPEFAPSRAVSDDEREDAVISAFLRHVSVSAVGLSTTITVTVSSRDPVNAARIADAIVATYLDMQTQIRVDVAQHTTDWLLSRIRQLGQQVQTAEANIQRYKAENNLTDTTNGGSLVDQQLAAINAQLVSAREDLAAKEAQNERIASLVEGGHGADVSQIVSSPLIIQLREQQADLIRQQAQLATRYGPRHPKMIAAESQKRDLDAKVAEEVRRIVGSVESEVAVARAQVRSLEDSLQRAESEAAEQNMARVKLQSLEANAASTRSMYESFVSRLRETQGQDAFDMVEARQISHAPVPVAPSSPPRLIIAIASVPAGLLFGFLAALLMERLTSDVNPDLREKPAVSQPDPFQGIPVLAELTSAALQHCPALVVERPTSPPAQALRALAQRIAAQGPRIVAVTSLDRREGQTSFAAGLARAASQLGLRVVLVEGNLGAPAASSGLGLALPRIGLVDVLSRSARLSQATLKDPRSTALLLSGSVRHAAPQQIWVSSPAKELMAHLKRAADIVIIDAAPIARGSELPLIAGISDALIVVATWNGTPRPGLASALDHLKATTTVPAGLVLWR